MTLGVLLMAYGTPESPEDVEPYYTHIRGGRAPSPEAVERLRKRYEVVGGRTPLLSITRNVRAALEQSLNDSPVNGRYRVYVGMKHWHPFIGDVIPEIAHDGVADLVALALAPHYSQMSIGGYRKSLDAALQKQEQPMNVRFVDSWHMHPQFIELIAARVRDSLEEWPADERPAVKVIFSAHSLPVRIREWNDPYEAQLLESCRAVTALTGHENWTFAWQSAGETGEPWLGPDIVDVLDVLHRQGVRDVLSVPIGFVSDHLEIQYDIDYEAARKSRELGIELRRTPMPNADPAFVRLLASVVTEASPMRSRELVIGTRASALAVAQTEIAISALRLANPSAAVRIERIRTEGDIRADRPLSQMGRGIFVTEIENALRDGRIDIAVHSAKDLPSVLDELFTIGAFLPRADARDVLVSPGFTLATLPAGSRVGTSSPRRMCLLRAARPDLELREIRGNVDTRLRKLVAGEFDAIVLAGAGLQRLHLESQATEWLEMDTMIPCVGQGALALEVRAADDEDMLLLLGMIDHRPTRAAVTAERAFLAELGAGCEAAAGAHAAFTHDGALRLTAFIGDSTGQQVRTSRLSNAKTPEELGSSVARELLRRGGAKFLARKSSALAGKCIAITRPVGQERELSALLRANGAIPISCPTIAIESSPESGELDASAMEEVDWALFTSINAVTAVADHLDERGGMLPPSLRLGVAGNATARALEERIRAPDFVAPRSNADALARNLPVVANESVVFFRGDLAGDTLTGILRARGAVVREIVVYRTVPGDGAGRLASGLKANEFDAVVFSSPSSISFSADALDLLRLREDRRPLIICIGPTTSKAAAGLGITADSVAAMQTAGGIVESLERAFLDNPENIVSADRHV